MATSGRIPKCLIASRCPQWVESGSCLNYRQDMISGQKLLRPMWHVATLASIIGLLVGVMAPITSLSMAVPVFTGQRMRDAMMVAFITLPLLQVTLVIVATLREAARPRMALKLYVLTVVLLAILIGVVPAIPLLA